MNYEIMFGLATGGCIVLLIKWLHTEHCWNETALLAQRLQLEVYELERRLWGYETHCATTILTNEPQLTMTSRCYGPPPSEQLSNGLVIPCDSHKPPGVS